MRVLRKLRNYRRESPAREGRDQSPSSIHFHSAWRGLRCAPSVSSVIRRGTPAPTPGQSDKFGVPDRGSLVPQRDRAGTDAKHPSTSESADTPRKPRGNEWNRGGEDRSNGRLARPAPRRCANLELPTQTASFRFRRWESSPFRAGRMPRLHSPPTS